MNVIEFLLCLLQCFLQDAFPQFFKFVIYIVREIVIRNSVRAVICKNGWTGWLSAETV